MEIKEVATTDAMAGHFHCSPKTVRKNYSETGHCFGIVPVKVGGRLLWSAVDIAKVLNGETLG